MTSEYIDEWYNYAVSNYLDHLIAAIEASNKAAGKKAKPRVFWTSVIFTRLCTLSASIQQLLPVKGLGEQKARNWDFSSVASLARNFIECYQTFFYLCIDEITEEEWSLRKGIFNLHDATAR